MALKGTTPCPVAIGYLSLKHTVIPTAFVEGIPDHRLMPDLFLSFTLCPLTMIFLFSLTVCLLCPRAQFLGGLVLKVFTPQSHNLKRG